MSEEIQLKNQEVFHYWQISVKALDDSTITVNTNPYDTIGNIKIKIQDFTGKCIPKIFCA